MMLPRLYSTTFLCRIILVKAWSLSHHFGESLSSWINEVHDYILWWRGTSLTNTSAKKKCKAAALTIFYIHIQSLIQKVDIHLLSALSQLFHTIFVKLNQTCKFVYINILRRGKIDTYLLSKFSISTPNHFVSLVFYSNQVSMAAFSAIIVSSFE